MCCYEKIVAAITVKYLLEVFQLVSVCGSCLNILELLKFGGRISVLTISKERGSYKAEGTGETTIGKKRSLLVEPVVRSWLPRLYRKGTRIYSKYVGTCYVCEIGDSGILHLAIHQRMDLHPLHIVTAASTTSCPIHVRAFCSNPQ